MLKALGQLNLRHIGIVETERLLTSLTEEVRMLVVVVLVVVAVAELIAHTLAAALDDMHEVMLAEEGQGTEDVRLVDGQDLIFQLRQGDGMQGLHQFLEYHNTVCRRLDTVFLQQLCLRLCGKQ